MSWTLVILTNLLCLSLGIHLNNFLSKRGLGEFIEELQKHFESEARMLERLRSMQKEVEYQMNENQKLRNLLK